MKANHCFVLLALLGLSFGTDVAHGSDLGGEATMDQGDNIVMVYEKYPMKIHCNLTNENGEVINGLPLDWLKDGQPVVPDDRIKIFQDNFTLLFTEALRTDTGDYKCELKTEDVIKPSRDFKVIWLVIKKMEKSLDITEKEKTVIECPVEGDPVPTVIWLKDRKPMADLIANDSRISLGPNSKNVPNGTLTITYSEKYDRGNYTCNITSLVETHGKWTYLRVKDTYAALWPFIGIVVEVVILGIIIVIFEKRRAKAEFDESDTDQGNDQ